MSAVLCLPACLCVSTQRPVARPPTGTRQKRFTAAGLPIPRVPLGATNPEQRSAAARSLQLAAPRSGSQRRPATAPSPCRKCRDRNSDINEFLRPTSKAALPATATTSTTTGRPAPAALPAQCYNTHLNNHPRTTPSRGTMVNWDEAGKTWPQAHPHSAVGAALPPQQSPVRRRHARELRAP